MAYRNSKRSVILEAAARRVAQSGAAHLTIDAVAKEAGISKGGLLYHFPSKEALLVGMLEQLLASARKHLRGIVDEVSAASSRPDLALVALLAVEGMHLLSHLNLLRLTPVERQQVRDCLTALSEEAV